MNCKFIIRLMRDPWNADLMGYISARSAREALLALGYDPLMWDRRWNKWAETCPLVPYIDGVDVFPETYPRMRVDIVDWD